MTEGKTNIIKYLIMFAIVYFVFSLIALAIIYIFDIEQNTFINFATDISCPLLVGLLWVKEYKLYPSQAEKLQLAFGSLIISYTLTILITFVFLSFQNESNQIKDFFSQMFGSMSGSIEIAIFGIVILFYFLLYLFCYGRALRYISPIKEGL